MYRDRGVYVFPDKDRMGIFAYDSENAVEYPPLTYAEQLVDFLEIEATPHNYRTSCFVGVCLQIFRHLAQNLLERRQPYCVDFVQSAEKFADATARQ